MSATPESADTLPSTAPINRPASDRLFILCVALLACISLFPIFGLRLLPMQDYPQHLLLSHITATFENPAFNWKEFYEVDLGPRPYMLWYLLMKPLAMAIGVENAGKLLFSAYIALVTLVVAATKRYTGERFLPWGALLLYPFAFNQMYFMGFSNYIISLPLLFIALLDLEKAFRHPLPPLRLALHGVYLLLLLLNHPYTVLVYIVLAVSSVAFSGRKLETALKTLAPAIAAAFVFCIWYAAMHHASSAPNAYTWGISWWPASGTLGYYLLMFTGMQLTDSVDWATVAMWCLCAGSVAVSWVRNGKVSFELRWPVILFIGSFTGFLILPFWLGYYSYFNLRLAPVTYFALALLLSRLRISRAAGLMVAGCSAGLLLLSICTQAGVSREAATIIPVVANMEKNARVLPLVFVCSSHYLDPAYFYQVHAHEANYYHIVKGGGANPALFPNAMMPVQYRPGISLPSPATPAQFSLPRYAPFYDYFLVRQPPADFTRMMIDSGCLLLAASEHWQVFSKKENR